MPRRYRQKGNVCAKVNPDNCLVPNVWVMWRLFTRELNETAHEGRKQRDLFPLEPQENSEVQVQSKQASLSACNWHLTPKYLFSQQQFPLVSLWF